MALTDQVIMPGSDYQAICNATRNLTGKTETLKSGDISTELGTIGIVEQATPSLTLNAATGVVTAEATQAAGLVAAGTKTATMQLTTQSAKTVAPTEAEQTAVASGKYTTGDVVVAAVPTTYVGSGVARKSSSDLTADGATVNVPAGYYENAASKSVATTTQATPSISVNADGLITASATQSAGYVTAGTKSATQQLPTQAAKTIAPSLYSQIAVPAGKYTIGAVTVAAVQTATKTVALNMASGDQVINSTSGTYMTSVTVRKPSTLISSNIKKDVNIGGVIGTFEGGVDLPFTKLATVSTDNGILSFSFTGYYDTIIAKRSGTNKILTAVFGSGLKASFSIGSEGEDLSTSGFSFDYVGGKFNVTWNICDSSGSVWYEGSYEIYGCKNG